MSPSIAVRQHFIRFPSVMSLTMLVVFLALSSSVSSSPLSMDSSSNHKTHQEQEQTMNYNSAGLNDEFNDEQISSYSSNNRHSMVDPSSWYVQPRAHANQFLSSHFNDIDPLATNKWWRKFHHDNQLNDFNFDLDDNDADLSSLSSNGFHKRSAFLTSVGSSHLKKRKQMNKPPMEVMNEIVNSIYL